jgi:hypothetical protein
MLHQDNNVDWYPAVKAHPPTNGIPRKSNKGNNQLAQKESGDPEEKSIVNGESRECMCNPG